MLKVDMWYGNEKEDADKIDISFYPSDGEYRGSIWKGGRVIGDYVCDDSLALEKDFPQLKFAW